MTEKFKILFTMIQKLALTNPEIAIGVGIVLLILLLKKTKFMLGLIFLGALGLVIWVWFTSSFEKRNENQKFKRYKEERTRPSGDDESTGAELKKGAP